MGVPLVVGLVLASVAAARPAEVQVRVDWRLPSTSRYFDTAYVELVSANGGSVQASVRGVPQGSTHVLSVPAGEYVLRARPLSIGIPRLCGLAYQIPGPNPYLPYSERLTLDSGERVARDLRMQAGGRLRIDLVAPEGSLAGDPGTCILEWGRRSYERIVALLSSPGGPCQTARVLLMPFGTIRPRSLLLSLPESAAEDGPVPRGLVGAWSSSEIVRPGLYVMLVDAEGFELHAQVVLVERFQTNEVRCELRP